MFIYLHGASCSMLAYETKDKEILLEYCEAHR